MILSTLRAIGPRRGGRGIALRVVALVVGVLIVAAAPAYAAPTTMVDLGDASTYAALSGASVGNTVSAAGTPRTKLRGEPAASRSRSRWRE